MDGATVRDLVVGIADPANPDAAASALADRVVPRDRFTVARRVGTLAFADGARWLQAS